MSILNIMETPFQIRNAKLAEVIVKNLKSRYFDAYYCSTKAEALGKIMELIPSDDVVAWGGSMTMEAIGVIDEVKKSRKVIDRDNETDRAKKVEMMRQALLADTFLMGTNAITIDGELFNIDANGNRVAALTFGPKQVIVACGMNKVTASIEEAIARVRSTAAPINAQRFPIQTPCKVNGVCTDCKSKESICCSFVRTRLCHFPGRIKVVLIGESLGL